jgi:hypothetical protein
MRKFYLSAALAASIAVSGCTTPGYGYNDPYYNNGYNQNRQAQGAVTGGAIGAVGGAVAGAVLPGVNPVTGAVVGGIAGAVLGAVINNKQYYRDTRGYCYYVDHNGNPVYDYNTRC